ncbi:MAG: aldehyde dehydrogenase family protein, partial [Candidatus Micrarchaeota archaeon]
MPADSYRMLIGGEWVGAEETSVSLNPATEEPVGRFASGNAKHVDMAVDAARDAFLKWSRTPPPARAR